jgi:hypothetical membrane protein
MSLSRTAKIGAGCWTLASPVFLATTVVVGLRWRNPGYSWATNNISDLGNLYCGQWDTTRPRYVCPPWHDTMNIALYATAALLIAGSVLTWRALGRGAAERTAQVLVLAAGIGYALAGAYPADADENNHFLAALLILCVGNIGLLVAAAAPGTAALASVRWPSIGLGLIAAAGTVAFAAQAGPGIAGAMERVAVFPLLVWAGVVGVALRRHVHEGLIRPVPPYRGAGCR